MIRREPSSWGITWERTTVRRGGPLRRMATLIAAGLAATFAGIVPAGAAASPLPDLASLEQVVGAPAAWQNGANGTGVDVAVLDTGVTPVPGLDGTGKLLFGPDLSFDSQDPTAAYVDNFGHGTAIASIIAGNDGTSSGFKGVAPNARIVSVKVGSRTGAVDVSQIIAGIDWVVQHAHDPGTSRSVRRARSHIRSTRLRKRPRTRGSTASPLSSQRATTERRATAWPTPQRIPT
jgi:subtilisin family serine protease